MTQEEFAGMFGVPLGTLRNWAQGIREPTGAATALRRVAAKHQNIVRRTFAAA